MVFGAVNLTDQPKFHVLFYVMTPGVSVILRFSSQSKLLQTLVTVDWKRSMQMPGYTSHDWLLATWADIPCDAGLYRLTGYFDIETNQSGGCYVIDRQGNTIT